MVYDCSWVVADVMTGVSFRRLPALLCLYWQVYLRQGQKIKLLLLLLSDFLGIGLASFGEDRLANLPQYSHDLFHTEM